MCGNMAIISYINDMRGIKPDYCSKKLVTYDTSAFQRKCGYQLLTSQTSLIKMPISSLVSMIMLHTDSYETTVIFTCFPVLVL